MATFKVTVGWTHSVQPDSSYHPMMDGFRPGAVQSLASFTLHWTNPPQVDDEAIKALGIDPVQAHRACVVRTATTIAELVFEATNQPRLMSPAGLEGQITDELDRISDVAREAGHYSISVGDTVTVDGLTLACSAGGWLDASDHTKTVNL